MRESAERAALLLRADGAKLLPVIAVHVALVLLLGDWIIDDAAISFAYARNVAHGHGFVSTPGLAPVEGFSNFLWVLLLVPLFWLRLFHPVVTPKLIGLALVIASLVVVRRLARSATGSDRTALLATLLVAAAPPIVIWTCSGLENALFLLLTVMIWARLTERRARWAIEAGALTGLLSMCRPEGMLLLGGSLIVAAVDVVRSSPSRREAALSAGRIAGGFALVHGPFLAFRMSTFGLPFPHTYYAKRIHTTPWKSLAAIAADPAALASKLADLARGAAGPLGATLLVATAIAAFYLAARRLPRALGAGVALQAVAIATYLWMDRDWMGEHRFGTAAIALSLAALPIAASAVIGEARSARARRITVATAVLLAAALFAGWIPRIVAFSRSPPAPFADIDRKHARRLEAYAAAIGIERGSVLLADVGAVLYGSRLRVFDAAGLCEPAVVHTLKEDTGWWLPDHPRFYDWVFEDAMPTFITTQVFWSYVTNLERDPRFARDYAPIDVYPDEYVQRVLGVRLRSGTWVRRSALRSEDDLARLRASYAPPPPAPPVIDRLADAARRSLGRAPPRAEDLMREARAAIDANEPDRAARLLEGAVAAAPGDRGAVCGLAFALDEANRAFEARPRWSLCLARAEADGDAETARRARERLGDDRAEALASIMQGGVQALHQRGDAAAAADAFRRVLAASPTHYGATYQLAIALDRLGRRDEARALWERVLEMAIRVQDQPAERTARARLAEN